MLLYGPVPLSYSSTVSESELMIIAELMTGGLYGSYAAHRTMLPAHHYGLNSSSRGSGSSSSGDSSLKLYKSSIKTEVPNRASVPAHAGLMAVQTANALRANNTV
jgi:hypothetical protein